MSRLAKAQPHLMHVVKCSGNVKCNSTAPALRHKPSKCFQLIPCCTCTVLVLIGMPSPPVGKRLLGAQTGVMTCQAWSTTRHAQCSTDPTSAPAALCALKVCTTPLLDSTGVQVDCRQCCRGRQLTSGTTRLEARLWTGHETGRHAA